MKKKAKKYIKGYQIGPLLGNQSSNTNEWTIKLPATAAVLDGISTVVIAPQPITFPPTAQSYFDLNINNERVASKLNLLYTSIFWSAGLAGNPSTYIQNYHPIPRPLSGSDEVRIIFEDCYWIALGLTGPSKVYFHFHYQPKQ